MHVRTRLTANFTVLANCLAQRRGSAVTVGVAAYILSLPDGAPVSIKALAAHFSEGEILLARALNELVQDGYLERRVERVGGGRIRTRTYFHDVPVPVSVPEPVPEPVPVPVSVPEPVQPAPDLRPAPAPDPTPAPGAVPGPATGPDPDRDRDRGPDPDPDRPPPSGSGGGRKHPLAPVNLPGAWRPAGHCESRPPSEAAERVEPVEPVARAVPAPRAVAARPALPRPSGEVRALLTGLRRRDPRLLLSEGEIAALAPAVGDWLNRGATGEAVAETLTAGLPAVFERRPARILAYRLGHWNAPVAPEPAPRPVVVPMQNCDGCDRAFRAPRPGICGPCTQGSAHSVGHPGRAASSARMAGNRRRERPMTICQ
ncbi:hypothetical protein AB0D08_04015 [Kitasatospora sp. NPDC048540]|uniref:hypothetical protein n=1 Tax=Kitasatospora sp. NPDC048540 TaxID=3155634 RepID=UPI0033F876FF